LGEEKEIARRGKIHFPLLTKKRKTKGKGRKKIFANVKNGGERRTSQGRTMVKRAPPGGPYKGDAFKTAKFLNSKLAD